jgi:hypothetical protein
LIDQHLRFKAPTCFQPLSTVVLIPIGAFCTFRVAGAIAQSQLFCGISATLDVSFQFATVQRCSSVLMARRNDLVFQGGEEYGSRIDGRQTLGRYEGATAEKAVPFSSVAAHRSDPPHWLGGLP